MSQSREHVPFLDHLRGLAALLVFATHSYHAASEQIPEWNDHGLLRNGARPVWMWLAVPAEIGWIGVSIFFVISGFCIHLSHERSGRKRFDIFYIRRFFRLYPPYMFALLFFAFVFPFTRLHFHAALLTHDWATTGHLGFNLVSHILLLHNLANCPGINFSFWSIAVEAQLYLLYPTLLWLVRKAGWTGALLIVGAIELSARATIGILHLIHPPIVLPELLEHFPLIFWFSWAVGAVLAQAHLEGTPYPFRKLPLTLVIGLFFICNFIHPLSPFCFTLAAIATAICIARLLSGNIALPTAGFGGAALHFLEKVGFISYSVYLLHQPFVMDVRQTVVWLFRRDFSSLEIFGLCWLVLAPVLAASWMSHRWLELPSTAWGKWIVRHHFTNAT